MSSGVVELHLFTPSQESVGPAVVLGRIEESFAVPVSGDGPVVEGRFPPAGFFEVVHGLAHGEEVVHQHDGGKMHTQSLILEDEDDAEEQVQARGGGRHTILRPQELPGPVAGLPDRVHGPVPKPRLAEDRVRCRPAGFGALIAHASQAVDTTALAAAAVGPHAGIPTGT